MALPYHVWYRLVRKKWPLAAEVAATQPSRRSWVGVYPLSGDSARFNVRHFEVEKDFFEADYDISEDELLNSEMVTVDSEEELELVLARWLDDLEKLVLPTFCDYPI